MKILHVVDLISQHKGGGSARVPYQMAAAQAKLGHEVTIYSSDLHANGLKSPKDVTLQTFGCWLNFLNGLRITPSMLFASFRKFDIIHMHNYRTLQNLIARGGGLTSMYVPPYVVQAHGSCLPIRSTLSPLHDLVWGKYLLSNAARCIATSQMEVDQYTAEGAKRCKIMDLGIDLEEFENLPPRQEKPHKTVLYLGKLHEIKGPDLLVRAFAQLDRQNVRLVVASWDDGWGSKIRWMVDNLGIADKVDFVGFADVVMKKQLYVDADAYILPSRYEAFGLCILEAAACGTPSIITDRCAIANRVPGYCTDVVPFEDDAITRAIDEALSWGRADEDRQKRIDWARQFSWERIAAEMVELYEVC